MFCRVVRCTHPSANRSARVVNPERSAKSTVTWRRSAWRCAISADAGFVAGSAVVVRCGFVAASAVVRCGVHRVRSAVETTPLPGAEVVVELRSFDDRVFPLAAGKTGADGYLSGTGGAKSYVQLEKFEEAGLLHEFQQFTHPVYPQIHGGFVPRMAVLDLLFNVGPDAERLVKDASGQGEETAKAS